MIKQHYTIPLAYKDQVRSLCWVKDHLVDFAGGFVRFHLHGKIETVKLMIGYRFDRAIVSTDGEYIVIYETFGTKGLILKQEKLIREINRSYYFANSFEYPIAIFSYNGQTYIADCPDQYNLIEIEDIETGEKNPQKDLQPHDFFQSRLQVSPNKKWLLSAGWIWHPIDSIDIYSLSPDNFNRPTLIPLERGSGEDIGLWEVYNAVFMNDSRLLMSGTGNLEQEDANQEKSIVIYDLEEKQMIWRIQTQDFTGKLMAINDELAIGFYEHPKLFNLKTGEIIYRWLEMPTDNQNSSIYTSDSFFHIAIDPTNKRFAVALADRIEVVALA